MFKPGLIQTIGLPNADLVLHADDIEFARRVVRASGKLFLNTQVEIEDLEASWNIPKGSGLDLWICGLMA